MGFFPVFRFWLYFRFLVEHSQQSFVWIICQWILCAVCALASAHCEWNECVWLFNWLLNIKPKIYVCFWSVYQTLWVMRWWVFIVPFVCRCFSYRRMRHFSILLYFSLVRSFTHSFVSFAGLRFTQTTATELLLMLLSRRLLVMLVLLQWQCFLPFMLSIRSISRSPKYYSLQSSTIAIMPLI